MGLKFEVDLNNLEMYNNDLSNSLRSLYNEIQELDGLIAQMSDYWGGDAAVAYINLMRNRLHQARDVYDSLESLKDSVVTQIESIKDVDNVFEVLGYELTHW